RRSIEDDFAYHELASCPRLSRASRLSGHCGAILLGMAGTSPAMTPLKSCKMPSPNLPQTALAEALAQKIAALDAARLPQAVRRKCEELLIDVVGLAVT